MPAQKASRVPLSRREKDVAALVAQGLTNREIAQRLFISERTVESHLEHVREKLELKSRAQVAAWFVAESGVEGPSARHPNGSPVRSVPRTRAVALLAAIAVVAGLLGAWQINLALGGQRAHANSTAGTLKVVWATEGGDHALWYPGDIGLDSQGALYVLDRGNHLVQKLDSSGAYITSWGGYGSDPGRFITRCVFRCPPACFELDPVLDAPCSQWAGSLAVDLRGRVWVYDYTGRVQMFDTDGRLQSVWGKKGTGVGEFASFGFVAVDLEGDLVISDSLRVQRFAPDGRYLSQIGSAGNATGQYLHPGPVAIDSHRNTYVIDFECPSPCSNIRTLRSRILEFDEVGHSISWAPSPNVAVHSPSSLAIDAHDNLWVLENKGGFVDPMQKLWEFDSAGHVLRAWSTTAFHGPGGLALDKRGDVFIGDVPHDTDRGPNGRISKVSLS